MPDSTRRLTIGMENTVVLWDRVEGGWGVKRRMAANAFKGIWSEEITHRYSSWEKDTVENVYCTPWGTLVSFANQGLVYVLMSNWPRG